jgi:hypothetical protein
MPQTLLQVNGQKRLFFRYLSDVIADLSYYQQLLDLKDKQLFCQHDCGQSYNSV